MNSLLNTPLQQGSDGQPGLSWGELGLLVSCLLAGALAVGGPFVPQMAHYHAFADQRALWGVPHAMDVLSNLPFAVAGVWGLLALRGMGRVGGVSRAAQGAHRLLAGLFFCGLIVTAVCSSIYHLQPGNGTLALDRLGMVVAFAGLSGLAVADRISARAGRRLATAMLVAGPLAVLTWAHTGNLLPWSVLQGGGMLLLLALLACKPKAGAWGVPIAAVVAWYAVAKLLELGDHQVFDFTNAWVSGHSLKHIVAALAAWPVVSVMHNAQKMTSAPRAL